MNFVTLNMVRPDSEQPEAAFNEDTGEVIPTAEVTRPTRINTTMVRCFYARNNDKPGTRITFADGGGFAVTESPDEVEAALTGAAADLAALAA